MQVQTFSAILNTGAYKPRSVTTAAEKYEIPDGLPPYYCGTLRHRDLWIDDENHEID